MYDRPQLSWGVRWTHSAMNVTESVVRDLAALCDQATTVGWAAGELPTVGGRPDLFRGIMSAMVRLRGNARLPELSTLEPHERQAARRPSLSATHGMGTFPPHFDGVHRTVPARLVVLYCVRDGQARPTTLHSWDAVRRHVIDQEKLTREVFIFRNGRRSFADTIASNDRAFVRFDSTCMAPATNGARALLESVKTALYRSPHCEHDWRPHSVLIIDNWSTLHGRGVARASGVRVLYRATFEWPYDRV